MRTERENNIKWRQLFENVPKVLTELRGRKEPLRDRSWGRRAKLVARRTQESATSVPLVPELSYKDEDDFNGPEPNCLETRQEYVETRTECVETRA